MRQLLFSALMLIGGIAEAACPRGGAPLYLEIPALGDSGANWSSCIRRDLMLLSTTTVAVGLNAWNQMARIDVSTVGAYNSSRVYFSSAAAFGSTISVMTSTLTVAASGIITAPSQPCVHATGASQNSAGGANNVVFFGTDVSDVQNMHSVSVASGTFTIPVGGDGFYSGSCSVATNAAPDTYQHLFVTHSTLGSIGYSLRTPPSGVFSGLNASFGAYMTAGQTIQCQLGRDNAAALTICSAASCQFYMCKQW